MIRPIAFLIICLASIVGAGEPVSSIEACSCQVSNQQQARSSQELRDNFKRCLDQTLPSKGFSGAVLVSDGKTIQVDQGYGPGITTHTRFYVASITKQFTAAAILRLQEEGRLSVKDLISKYLKNVPPDKAGITIHHLLTHTSGLAQNYAADGIANRDEAVKALLKGPLKSSPGERFGYSDDGYNLLAVIVEIASGQSYESFLRQNLLGPAGMTQTGFWAEPLAKGEPPIAPMRRDIPPGNKLPNWGFRGSTGMFSTTGDLYKWQQALFADKVLTKPSREKLLTPYAPTPRGMYTYGWFVSKTDKGEDKIWTAGYEDFGHNGIINVYATGAVSVVLTNSGDIAGTPARDLASREIEAILLGTSDCGSSEKRPSLSSANVAVPIDAPSNARQSTTSVVALNLDALTLLNTNAEVVQYRGQQAVHLTARAGSESASGHLTANGHLIAIVKDFDFKDGVIEISIAGALAPGAPPEGRGFVGIAFRIDPNVTGFEYVYLRPTNGRANDQLLRNHSTQYASFPDYPADRLRKENPGVYESYVDLEPGAWTKFKLVVRGNKADLYIHGSDQPCLIVNDLKRGARHGAIGLWIGLWAEGYFSDLRVTSP
jgi:CubicO group peptidase (beta-lactamase class C family)